MNSKLPHALYINKDDRPDRRAHMEEMLTRHGFEFERIPAVVPTEIGRFHTAGSLGNWISHLEAIERAGDRREQTIIFEDDVVIRDFPKMIEAIETLREMNRKWIFLYFYGYKGPGLVGPADTNEQHCYLVNPKWSKKISDILRDRLHYLFISGDRDARTYQGNFAKNVLQKAYPFYGTRPLVYQDRSRFGSETGWKKLYEGNRK